MYFELILSQNETQGASILRRRSVNDEQRSCGAKATERRRKGLFKEQLIYD